MELHVDNKTPPAIRRFFRLDSWFGKGSKIRLETLKPLENTGLFRFVEIIPQGHSHVSLLIDMGFSVVAIGDRVGHESERITLDYAHLFPSKQDEMARKLNERGEEYVS